MILSFLIIACYSSNKEKSKQSQTMRTIQEIKALSSNISKIQFDTIDSIEHTDQDAINLFLNESKIINKPKSFFDVLDKALNKEDSYIKEECNNCIKILSQSAIFTFVAIKKSIANTVKFYQSTNKSCSVKDIQLIFYNDESINYTTEVYHLRGKLLNTFQFPHKVTFDKVQLNATSSNPSLLCLSKFSLLNH